MSAKKEKLHFESVQELLGAPEVKEGTTQVRLDQIYPFENHPFKVLDDEKMDDLVKSIKENGVLVPVLIRPDDEGNYEMISGHRRLHAAQKAGLAVIPAIIKEMTNDEATIAMVDANIQREEILPSERAFSLKMKMDAMRRQGYRSDINDDETSTHNGRRLENEADKVDLIIIDYLQLIEYDGNYTDANRNEELSAECRMLKNLAAKTNAAVLVISELNRTPEYRPDHRPMLSDLRGSGEIEEIADVVMLLYRQDYYHYQENDEVDKNVADLSIAKNNYGPLRSVYLMWNPEMLIFSESAYLGELLHRADMNPAYTFRTFMVNEKNMNAYSKAMEAAKGNPDYRQLYIAGGSGSGKTHLMQAIGEYIFQKNTSVRIKYMTARMLREAITYGDMNQDIGMVQYIRDGIEENDVILIDDIEGLSGDNRMQEEAIEILDAMVMCNKQIIIAGSLIPSHVHDISERFRMRLKRMSLCTLGDMDDYTDISE